MCASVYVCVREKGGLVVFLERQRERQHRDIERNDIEVN